MRAGVAATGAWEGTRAVFIEASWSAVLADSEQLSSD
jgi:hypothetical protein